MSTATLTAASTRVCPRCKGSGRESGPPRLCGICHGRGVVPAPSRVPITHHDDPRTSAMAEREITAMGERDRQQMTVYAAVVANPGRTSNELSRLIEGMDRHQVAKRLPEIAEAVDGATPRKVILIERGPVRACSVTQRPCVTWWKLGEAPRGESE